MPKVLESEKELRFTRSGQAVVFWVAAAVFAVACVILVSVSFHRGDNPLLPHPGWALLPMISSYVLVRLAIRLTKHAYLILTPLGIEVFPFFRPERGMQSVFWSEIHSVEADEQRKWLTLHFNEEKSAGIHLSLRPIETKRREFLLHALRGRLSNTLALKE
jgi:hypothetical protein